jgi:hypothetical protein
MIRYRQWSIDNKKNLSINEKENSMKKEEIQKTLDFIKSLNNAINLLQDGDTIDNVFSSEDIENLQDLYFSEIENIVGNEKAQYLWNLLTQYLIGQQNNGEFPSLWIVKEFSWYGDDLTPDHGARQYEQAQKRTQLV